MRRVWNGIKASSVGLAANLASRTLEIPLLIAIWGAERYGAWLILLTIPTLLSSSDVGLATVAGREMAAAENRGDHEAFSRHFSSAVLAIGGSTSLLCVITALVLWQPAVKPALGVSDSLEANILVPLLLARTFILVLCRVLQAPLVAIGQYPIAILIGGLADVGAFIALIAGAAIAPQSYIWAGALMLIVALGQLLVTLAILRRRVKRPFFAMRHFTMASIRLMAAPSLATFALATARNANYSIPRLILGPTLGPVAVTIFHAHRQFARLINFALLFMRPFGTEMTVIFGRVSLRQFSSFVTRTSQIFSWTIVCAVLAGAANAAWFFPVWTNGEVRLQWWLLGVLMLASVIESQGFIALLPLEHTNRHVGIASVFVIANAAILPVGYLVADIAGLVGVAACLLAIDCAVATFTYQRLGKFLGEGPLKLFWKSWHPPLFLWRTRGKGLDMYGSIDR